MTPVVYLLMVGQKNGTEKMMNDKTELVKEAKNDKASRCCWSAYQKKRLGEMGLSEMKLGEMLPNQMTSQGPKDLSAQWGSYLMASSRNISNNKSPQHPADICECIQSSEAGRLPAPQMTLCTTTATSSNDARSLMIKDSQTGIN